MKSLPGVVSSLCVVAFAVAVGCGGGDDSSNKGAASSGSVVSCDIMQLGMHYCEEAPGSPGTNTGCPTMMAGVTPGSGCSRAGVTGTCTEGVYKFFLYTSGVAASAIAGICPSGTFEPSTLDGGIDISACGSTSMSTAGACAELEACCNKMSIDALKTSCLQVYASVVKSGDKTCAGFLPLYKINCQ